MPSREVPLISPSAMARPMDDLAFANAGFSRLCCSSRASVLHDAPASARRSDMSEPKSAFLQDAVARGFVHQCTDLEALDRAACGGHVVAYIGFDATADSLHVGSL